MKERRPKKPGRQQAYRDLLSKALGAKELKKTVKSHDMLGNIAIIEEERNRRKVAEAVMRANRRIETVLLKRGAVKGRYRIRGFSLVAGKRNFMADYKENGCRFIFDVRKVFFSPRLSFERKRISELTKDGEKVMVMFAGVGPFAIEIAKAHRNCTVVAIELNKAAYSYMVENIELNKTKNVTPVLGDVSIAARNYAGFADRIVMPLPRSASEFLEPALLVAKKRCTLHYYTFSKTDEMGKKLSGLRSFFKAHRKRVRLLGKRVVRSYSPQEVELVFDFVVE